MKFCSVKENKEKNGIYVITNVVDRRLYIGSTARGFYARYKEHLLDLRKKQHSNDHLQNFSDKYKVESFEFYVLEIVQDKDKIYNREQYYLDKYWKTGLLFNTARNAEAPARGVHRSEEFKEKIRQAQIGNINCKGRVVSEETKEKMRKAKKGKALSENHKMKISLTQRGKVVSEETRKKMSLAQMGNTKNLGKKRGRYKKIGNENAGSQSS